MKEFKGSRSLNTIPHKIMGGSAINRRSSPQKFSWNLVVVQFFSLCVATLICALVMQSKFIVASVITGGLATILPNLYFVMRFSAHFKKASVTLRQLYFAELIKVSLTALLFISAVRLYNLSAPFLFVGFFAAFLAYITAPIWMFRGEG